MAKYICKRCGKQFEDNSQEAQDLFKFYGWIRCVECDRSVISSILGETFEKLKEVAEHDG